MINAYKIGVYHLFDVGIYTWPIDMFVKLTCVKVQLCQYETNAIFIGLGEDQCSSTNGTILMVVLLLYMSPPLL